MFFVLLCWLTASLTFLTGYLIIHLTTLNKHGKLVSKAAAKWCPLLGEMSRYPAVLKAGEVENRSTICLEV